MILTFLSDYGPGDEYVGVVHGVIARIAPEAPIDPAGLVRLERAAAKEGGAIVLEIDAFGNLRLDAAPGTVATRVNGRPVTTARTFGDVAPGGLLLYTESDGGPALAVNGG